MRLNFSFHNTKARAHRLRYAVHNSDTLEGGGDRKSWAPTTKASLDARAAWLEGGLVDQVIRDTQSPLPQVRRNQEEGPKDTNEGQAGRRRRKISTR